MAVTALRYAYSFSYWAILVQRQQAGMKTLVCSGAKSEQATSEIRAKSLPHVYLLTCKKEISNMPILQKKFFDGNLYIFVCSEQACLSPVSSVSEAFKLIDLRE